MPYVEVSSCVTSQHLTEVDLVIFDTLSIGRVDFMSPKFVSKN